MEILSMPLRHWAFPQARDTWVLALSVLIVVPHLFFLPTAITLLCAMCWFVDLYLISRRSRLSRAAKTIVILIVVSTTVFVFPQMKFSSVGYALGGLTVAMKPLETYDRRGHRSFVILCFFCSLLFFFRDGSAAWFLYYMLCIVGVTGLLVSEDLPAMEVGRALGKSLALIGQALPLAAILFFVVPRIEQPFLEWNSSRVSAMTGVPDRFRFDGLGSLSESNEVAFEATFEGPAPAISNLYWRGKVFYHTDGITWDSDHYPIRPMWPRSSKSGGVASGEDQLLLQRATEIVSYRIRMGKPSDHWLISLDLPLNQFEAATLTEDYQLVPHQSFDLDFEYHLNSALSIRTPREPQHIYTKALKLPAESRIGSQTRSMGEELRAEYDGDANADQKIIQRLLMFFTQEPFFYTIDAPIYRNNPVDQFLFEGRYGYCTHFAASMTLLLRSAGVPARMVVGYHGGDWRPGDKTLIVRQRHAHAWVEAWVEGHGWLRIDPTAAIPQDRVLLGSVPVDEMSALNPIDQLVSQGENAGDWRQFLNSTQFQQMDQNASGINQRTGENGSGRSSVEWLTSKPQELWNTFVRNYDHSLQQNLLGRIAGNFPVVILLLGLIVLLSVLLVFQFWRKEGSSAGSCRIGDLYARLCRRLESQGLSVCASEPYQVLHQRLLETGRFDSERLAAFFTSYEQLRYRCQGRDVKKGEIRLLRKKLRRMLVPPSNISASVEERL